MCCRVRVCTLTDTDIHSTAEMASGAGEEGQQARVLDGKALAAEVRRKLAAEVEEEQKKDPSFVPGLAILQVGGREDSNVYIRMKTKAANEVSSRTFTSIFNVRSCGITTFRRSM